MSFTGIPKSGLAFLRDLRANNHKEWFEAHRAVWDDELLPAMIAACAELHARLSKLMPALVLLPRVGGSVFRLNRDIRFSKDKSPYKTNAAALMWEGAEKFSSPGVYLHISPDQVIFGGGLYAFEEAQLDRYRKLVTNERSGEELAAALAKAKKAGLAPEGEKLVKPPRGISPEHPRAELSKHKGLAVGGAQTPGAWVHTPEFLDRAEAAAKAYAPLHAWLRDELCKA